MRLNSAQFKRDDLPSSAHTFWEWFHSMMVLTQQYLESIWKKDYVIGFVSKKKSEEMLANTEEGTFLIRFSDSKLGGVTIGFKSK